MFVELVRKDKRAPRAAEQKELNRRDGTVPGASITHPDDLDVFRLAFGPGDVLCVANLKALGTTRQALTILKVVGLMDGSIKLPGEDPWPVTDDTDRATIMGRYATARWDRMKPAEEIRGPGRPRSKTRPTGDAAEVFKRMWFGDVKQHSRGKIIALLKQHLKRNVENHEPRDWWGDRGKPPEGYGPDAATDGKGGE